MSAKWQEALGELINFIDTHSEIKIKPNYIRLPDSVRPVFYKKLDTVRSLFLEEKSSNMLAEAKTLSQHYIKAEKEIIEILKLDKVNMENSVHRFLHDPFDELKRAQFDPLMGLLQQH